MEELGCMWGYQEGIDEMKHELLYTSLELETVRAEANEEMKRNKEKVRRLLNLLQLAYQERDDARSQLQDLVTKLSPSTPKPNSSITESNTHSLNSSLFDSPNMAPFVHECNGSMPKSDPFDSLLKGKKLPQRGKLLQAVVEAGPLLSNIMLAGQLPRWRNPPPMQPLLKLHNVAKRAFDSGSNLEVSFGLEPTTSSTLSGRVFTINNHIPMPKRHRFH